MSDQTHEIDVHFIKGEGGTVHVFTDRTMEDGLVDREFDKITTQLGDIAATGAEIMEPGERAKSIDGFFFKYRDGREKPTKFHK